MIHYIKVYIRLIRLNASALLIYPANFYSSIVASLAWGFFSLYSIALLTSYSDTAFGWKREEILLLNGVYGILIGVFHTVFSRNFERFSSVIHLGLLDSVLTKPIDSQFLLSFWLFGWVSSVRVFISIFYVILVLNTLSLEIALSQIVLFFVLGICSLLLLYSVWYIVITLTVWFTRLSNLVELMFNITGIARYPREMLVSSVGFAIWLIIPLVIIINIPAKVFLHSLRIIDILELTVLASFIFIISRRFWKFALTHYSSVSS